MISGKLPYKISKSKFKKSILLFNIVALPYNILFLNMLFKVASQVVL